MSKEEDKFAEANKTWELERLYIDLAAQNKTLSPNAQIFLRGILCGFSPSNIGQKLNYQGNDVSVTVRQTLSKEVYPKIRALLGLDVDDRIDFSKVSSLTISLAVNITGSIIVFS
ncbi:MAG: hypothetical protein HC852_19350 [Acaryochloridaceae cyanobacterium RU_4_10]|nr:hypothetical protein [Acaryochloridaceae cyanobacterium RU_4_10]